MIKTLSQRHSSQRAKAIKRLAREQTKLNQTKQLFKETWKNASRQPRDREMAKRVRKLKLILKKQEVVLNNLLAEIQPETEFEAEIAKYTRIVELFRKDLTPDQSRLS